MTGDIAFEDARSVQAQLFMTTDSEEGRSAFLQKHTPQFRGG